MASSAAAGAAGLPRRIEQFCPLTITHAARPVESVLSVQLDDLLVVVGALEQLDARVEWPAVGTEADLVFGLGLG